MHREGVLHVDGLGALAQLSGGFLGKVGRVVWVRAPKGPSCFAPHKYAGPLGALAHYGPRGRSGSDRSRREREKKGS
jgi:hypothetical protein